MPDNLSLLIAANSSSPHRLQPGAHIPYGQLQVLNAPASTPLPPVGAPSDVLLSRLDNLLQGGATLVIDLMQDLWTPVRQFVAACERYLELPLNGNLYLTAAGHPGKWIHWDDTDVIFIQITGRKHWKIWKPFVRDVTLPYSSYAQHTPKNLSQKALWEDSRPIVLNKTTQPGDVLYIPRGFLHQASVPDGADSIHLTINPRGVVTHNWDAFLQRTPFLALANLLPPKLRQTQDNSLQHYYPHPDFGNTVTGQIQASFRRSLPPRLSHACRTERFQRQLLRVLNQLDSSLSVDQIKGSIELAGPHAFEDSCLAYLATLLPEYLSDRTFEHVSAAAHAKLHLQSHLCVRSPLAARVLPLWLAPNGFTTRQSMILYSRGANEPNQCNIGDAHMEFSVSPRGAELVPSWMARLLGRALHPETNPSLAVHPLDFVESDRSPSWQKHAAMEVAGRLIRLGVLYTIDSRE